MRDSIEDGARGAPARRRGDREMDTSLTRMFADGEVVQTPHVGEIARGGGRRCRDSVRA